MSSFEELYEHYILFTDQQRENFQKRFGGKITKRDEYIDFLINPHIGICPQSIISNNSKYWLELISYCDGEMGLTFPAPISELPDLFFKALGIVRSVRADLRKEKESGTKTNSHNNQRTRCTSS